MLGFPYCCLFLTITWSNSRRDLLVNMDMVLKCVVSFVLGLGGGELQAPCMAHSCWVTPRDRHSCRQTPSSPANESESAFQPGWPPNDCHTRRHLFSLSTRPILSTQRARSIANGPGAQPASRNSPAPAPAPARDLARGPRSSLPLPLPLAPPLGEPNGGQPATATATV